MNQLYKRALFGLVGLILVMGGIIFLSAGSLMFWQGYIYLIVFAVCVTIITVYFLQKDPGLVERRINVGPVAEKEKNQKIIQSFGGSYSWPCWSFQGLTIVFTGCRFLQFLWLWPMYSGCWVS